MILLLDWGILMPGVRKLKRVAVGSNFLVDLCACCAWSWIIDFQGWFISSLHMSSTFAICFFFFFFFNHCLVYIALMAFMHLFLSDDDDDRDDDDSSFVCISSVGFFLLSTHIYLFTCALGGLYYYRFHRRS